MFFNLDSKQRDVIAEWFLTTSSFGLYEPNLPPLIVASTLLPEQFRQAAGMIRGLLDNWRRYRLELPDIERDLLLLGCDPEQIKTVSNLLTRLSSIRERVWVDGRIGLQHVTGLPTVDDVNIVWSARPVFGGDSYYYFGSEEAAGSHNQFLGLTYLAILEIITSDNYGQSQRTALQVTEETFKRLLLGMRRAGEQLDILKEHTKALVVDAVETKKG